MGAAKIACRAYRLCVVGGPGAPDADRLTERVVDMVNQSVDEIEARDGDWGEKA